MQTYIFTLTLTSDDLGGDEFFEDAIAKDGTGITDVTYALKCMMKESNFIADADADTMDSIIKLVKYTDK